MIYLTLSALAILMGLSLYPLFANHLPNQRQNAAAVFGVILLGLLFLGVEVMPQLAQGTPTHAALQTLSFLFFGSAFLGRKRGTLDAEKSALIPFAIGSLATAAEIVVTSTGAYLGLIAVQAACLLGITYTYSNLPRVTLVKAVYFGMMYCLVNALYHMAHTGEYSGFIPTAAVDALYFALLGTCVFHMVFQDISRTRTRKGLNRQTKVDQDLMKLSFRSRRVLKDFKHDLRQPLSTLGILASVGKAISKDAEVTARYQHIQTAQKALKNMLEDFFEQLDNSIRYPQDDNRATLQAVNIHDVLAPLVEEYRLLAEVKELQIRYVPSDIKVLSNKEALTKIIRNGLDNAIKYTNKGGVVVGVRRRRGRACIQVVDTGSGVDSDKVATHNKGWGHGSKIVQDLSEQILAKTECRNRNFGGKVVGSVFSVLLPEEAEAMHRWKKPIYSRPVHFEAQVMATNSQDLLDIQRVLPVQGFDKVEFSLNGAYRAYLTALRKGMSPVYIMYVGDANQKNHGIEQLKLLGSLLDFEPCCILIYNANQESNPQVEFAREMIKIPLNPHQATSSLAVLAELFPERAEELDLHHDEADANPPTGVRQPHSKAMLTN